MSNKIVYQNFCQTTEDLPIFAQDWYLDAVCVDGNWDVAIVKEKEQIVATMPYFIKQKIGFSYSTMPLHTRHLGPYIIPEKRKLKFEHKYYAALIEQLPNVAHFVQDFSPQVANWLPFFWKDYQQTVRYTYHIALDDLDARHKAFYANIRRGINLGAKIVTIEHDLSLEEYYAVNKMSFDRQNIPIYFSFESLKKLHTVLKEKEACKMFFGRDKNGQIHAVYYLIWDKTCAYGLLAGNNPEFRHSDASTFVIWEVIRYTKEVLNLPLFDFCGSMIQGIERNRRYFNATQTPYFRVWKHNSKLFKLITDVRSIWK